MGDEMYGRVESSEKSKKTRKASKADDIFAAPVAVVSTPVAVETLSSVLSGLPVTNAHFADIQTFLHASVSSEVERRQIPEDDLREPRMDVVVPAVEALRYSTVRHAFAGLIAATMDARTANAVLPAYVEMLKQLSEDELTLLALMPPLGRYTLIADVVHVLPTGQIITVHRHALLPAIADKCTLRRNVPQYIDNLMRLNLISKPIDQQAADVGYRAIAQLQFVKIAMKAAPPKAKPGLEKSVCGVTDLGDAFRRACLGAPLKADIR